MTHLKIYFVENISINLIETIAVILEVWKQETLNILREFDIAVR